MKIVFEILKEGQKRIVGRYLKRRFSVWIVEPFHAFHHKKGFLFFPPSLPKFTDSLLADNKINFIKAKHLNAEEIYLLSADKAVDAIETIYPVYREEHYILFDYVSDVVGSSEAENIFKKDLCRRLAEFYSINIMLHRIEKFLGPDNISFYPDINVESYLYLKELISKNGQESYKHPSISFPKSTYVHSFLENLRKNFGIRGKLLLQAFGSGILSKTLGKVKKKKRIFTYGVLITSPRQFEKDQRGPDYIVDNKNIKREDVVYFPVINLKKSQKRGLRRLGGEVVYPGKRGRLFSHFPEWKKLLLHSFQRSFLKFAEEITAASIAFFSYFKWVKVLETIKIKHFISHADFGLSSITRNIALNQDDIQTWYFSDSMNFSYNFRDRVKSYYMRHPNWTYLNYDHFITWDNYLVEYFNSHPNAIKKSHVVGCLWSGHIREKNTALEDETIPELENLKNNYVLSCFDSTYSKNAFTSYTEGLSFANHIFQLADEIQDIFIILKEKKHRSVHYILDPINGPKLLTIYRKMEKHPRIIVCSNEMDASEVISLSDMVVSFPFTSTTFEALSVNRPAVWHDPMGYYKDTPYGKISGVTTHNYEELKKWVQEIKNLKPYSYKSPLPTNSPLSDPYRDGKAIDRFRDLLASADGKSRTTD
jgi:hypothetical protein